MRDNKTLQKKIINKKAVVGVIGLGYVGLPLAILFKKKGFKVIGFDNDKKKIRLLNQGISYIERINQRDVKSLKNYCFSTFEKISDCDILTICVPTPLTKSQTPNLSYIKETIRLAKKYLKKNQIIILESTSYPGTTEEEIVKKLNKKFDIGKNFFVGFSSERINPGVNENKIQNIPKVVSGYSKKCLKLIKIFYEKSFKKVVPSQKIEIAEFSKLLENIYRAVNISFFNEMKIVSDNMGLDIFEIIKIAKTKPYGFRPFNPGPGFGGHCIPIDPHYLFWKSKKLGISPKFIKLAGELNSYVIQFLIKKILKVLKKNSKKNKNNKILILGLAYKKNMDDMRESASLKLIDHLKKRGFLNIFYHDPHIKNFQIKKNLGAKRLNIINSSNLKEFDLVILMTDHDKFPYKLIYKNSKNIIDCRGKYKVDEKVERA